jgi:hypothetical protein
MWPFLKAPRQQQHLTNPWVFFDAEKKAAFVMAYYIRKSLEQA